MTSIETIPLIDDQRLRNLRRIREARERLAKMLRDTMECSAAHPTDWSHVSELGRIATHLEQLTIPEA
tara:strand:+ start:879 stop:1082 length:204 start_codon:yes stop_codon:yes gene_type:complete